MGHMVSQVNKMMNATLHGSTMDDVRDLERRFVVHSAALLIQSAWRECVSNPSYAVCRIRLLREFDQL